MNVPLPLLHLAVDIDLPFSLASYIDNESLRYIGVATVHVHVYTVCTAVTACTKLIFNFHALFSPLTRSYMYNHLNIVYIIIVDWY